VKNVLGTLISQGSPQDEAKLRCAREYGRVPAESRQQDQAADSSGMATGEREGGGSAERLPAHKRWSVSLGVTIENLQGALSQTFDAACEGVQAMIERQHPHATE
jgi:hypothetical protein